MSSFLHNSNHSSPAAAIVEELITKACNPPASPIQVVDLEQVNDDDEITIVAHNIVSAPSNDILIVSDNLTTGPSKSPLTSHQRLPQSQAQTIDLDAETPATNLPHIPKSQSPPSQNDDVLICRPVPSRSRSATTSTCHACRKPLSHRTSLTRCRHVLCPACCLCVVAQVEDPSHQPLVASNLRALPVCIVLRCAAPLSRPEVSAALAPPLIDTAFVESLLQFRQWQKQPPEHPVVGPANIFFPPYDPQPPPQVTADPDTQGNVTNLPDDAGQCLDPLVTDDFAAASAPLWVWDEEHQVTPGRLGAWLCAACGEYCILATDAPLPEPFPPPDDGLQMTGDQTVPDAPSHPHCGYARALGLVENVRGLAESRNQEMPKRRKTAFSRGDSSTRKRYRSANSIRSNKRRKVGFAKGTGYAGRQGNEWRGTSTKMLQQTARMDNEAAYWLSRVRCMLLLTPDAALTSWPGFMRLLIRECKLVPQLAAILINESIMDVQERVPLFVSALRVVHALTESPSLRMLITEPIEGANGRNIAELVESLSQQAAFLTSGAGAENLPPYTALLVKQIRRCIRVINRNNLIQLGKIKALGATSVNVDEDDDHNNNGSRTDSSDGITANGGCVSSVAPVSFAADKRAYLEEMKAHQFKAVPGLAQRSSFKAEVDRAVSFGAPQGTRQRRIAGEVASLFSSLPLSWSSTILLRVDEDRYDFLRACIFGPEDTPYDSGAFIFDIYLPPEYPAIPPKFRLLTTGGGKVRFNPNLYNSGKVCLSLLGTWSGPSWNSASTILQVLVSIQSLILVTDPYFNEPGFESQMGTSQGKQQSQRYNSRVRHDNAFHAIQANVKHPHLEFEAGIRTHFRLKRRYLKHVFKQWFPYACEMPQCDDPDSAEPQGNAAVPKVSVDPTLQPLSHQMFFQGGIPFLPGGQYPHVPAPPISVAQTSGPSFGPGRNFRSSQMSFANLQRIVDDLDSIS